jgi:hypothetical protein
MCEDVGRGGGILGRGGGRLEDAAVGEGDGAIAGGRKLKIVGDNYNGLVESVAEGEKEGVQIVLAFGIKVAGGLVGKKDGRAIHQGTRNGNTLLLTSTELARFVVKAVVKFEEGEELGRAVGCLSHRNAGNEGRHGDILQSGKLR